MTSAQKAGQPGGPTGPEESAAAAEPVHHAMPADPSDSAAALETVEIRDAEIRLGQLLKLHGVAEHGVMAKDMIAAGNVLVNGAIDTRRAAKIVEGDIVEVPAAGVAFRVASRHT